MRSKIPKVGFDLDGVLLYNPARILRPIVSFIKRVILKKTKLKFYYPHSPWEKHLWRLFHKSSIFIAPGMDNIRRLVKEKKIKAYIVTARYGFLGKELMSWAKKNNLEGIFAEIHYNKLDEQPHLFKERMIKELELDYFVEDNFDIVKYLDKKSSATMLWIYNIIDKGEYYPRRFAYLKKAVDFIKRAIRKST